MSVLERLRSEILPKAVREKQFGHNVVKFLEFKIDKNYAAADQFASSIYFGDVILETEIGDRVTQSVVVKAQAGGKLADTNDLFSRNIQLHNESLFYAEILPLLCQSDPSGTISGIFPRFFYAHIVDGNPMQDLLIFENVQKRGYKLSPWKAFNDYAHIKLSLEWLGKFHATSLVCKKKFSRQLKEVVSKMLESHWTEKKLAKDDAFFRENCKRGILPLQNNPNYKDRLKDLSALVERANLSMAKIVAPYEPLSLICHGDFCRNNIFYEYDADGKPCAVIFFDMATLRYSSPAIDLSFYLFMNSSPEVRSDHWMEILQTYYTSLTSNPELDSGETPSFEDFQLDLRRRGFYGYAHASFFLPLMLTGKKLEDEDWNGKDLDALIQMSLQTGGEEATRYVTKIVQFMIDQNFEFHYINDLKVYALNKFDV
ncbi:unnamed protein product [Bemisia tabaci]|uniref:CHK kinase-like domain-containing protein n=1 Tax=Bemisia tabaci TaxID=7038 RepID=A0A9P0F2P8_BEMTA|nr:unnamed protein product [Bemisia tabaci]